MNSHIKSLCLSLLLTVLFSTPLFAGNDPVYTNTLFGRDSSINTGAQLTTIDNNFLVYKDSIIQHRSINNVIRFSIDEESPHLLQSSFEVSVELKLEWKAIDGTIDSTRKILKVTYSQDSTNFSDSIAYYRFQGGVEVTATIVSISSNVGWDVSKVLKLQNEISVDRDYVFNCRLPLELENLGISNGELKVKWSVPAGFQNEYDLEWAWIDENALPEYYNGTTPNLEKIFYNNTTRINTPLNVFEIPLLYDGKGKLFVRVRPVQYRPGQRIEASWSYATNTGDPYLAQDFDGHEVNLNWQATTTFAEDGKLKSVVQYFDGSLRGRQTVTKDNESKRTIVAETMYDYQGRAVIQVLPAPTISNMIAYTRNFNQFDDAAPAKSVYDKLDLNGGACTKLTKQMKAVSDLGQTQYYSTANPLASTGSNKFIPDAGGYPFSEVRYTEDGTGRIATQGGVGQTHQINNGHDTKYFYQSPDQKELDGLFGTDAGEASHYFKNWVKDPNGQYSVSYVDMQGRTVATALAGPLPANLKALPSRAGATKTITRQLIDNETNNIVGKSIVSSKSLIVAESNTYTFSYTLTPDNFQLASCAKNGQPAATICYDCLYELKISIIPDCAGTVLPASFTNPIVKKNFTPGQYFNNCPVNGKSPEFIANFDVVLPEGSYTVVKELTVSSDAQQYYREEVFLKENACKKLQDFVNTQYSLAIAQLTCNVTCATCTTQLSSLTAFRDKFKLEAELTDADIAALGIEAEITAAYEKAKENCRRICNNESDDGFDEIRSIRDIMLMDVSPPSGQYAKVADAAKQYNIFNPGSSVAPWTAPQEINAITWNTQAGPYRDVYGNSSPINQSIQSGSITTPQQFSDAFVSSYAEQLLSYHPEFCKLKVAETQLKQVYSFGSTIQRINTFHDAGLLAGSAGLTNYLLANDPLFTSTLIDATTRSQLQQQMLMAITTNYQTITGQQCSGGSGSQSFGMWKLAKFIVTCRKELEAAGTNNCDPAVLSCLNGLDNDPPAAGSACSADLNTIWRNFRSFYLTFRRQLIANYLSQQCPNPSPTQLKTLGYEPRFYTVSTTPGSYNTGSTIIDQLANGNPGDFAAAMENEKESTCRANADMWLSNLRECPEIDAYAQSQPATWAAQTQVLLNVLTDICKGGLSYNDHPFGSSSLPTGAVTITNPWNAQDPGFRDFPSAVKYFITTVLGKQITAQCHPYLISYPPAYEAGVAMVNQEVITKPSACECERIGTLQTEYNAWKARGNTGTFSAYLLAVHATTISQADLDVLLSLCNNTNGNCNFLEEPIVLPAALQCKGSATNVKTCIECEDLDDIKTAFLAAMGLGKITIPIFSPQTPQEFQLNEAFTRFANYKTGFGKTWIEYADFAKACQDAGPRYDCNTLNLALSEFYASTVYLANQSGNACKEAFRQFMNTKFGANYTFDQWLQFFAPCGPLPDVCSVKFTCQSMNQYIDAFYAVYKFTAYKLPNCQATFASFMNGKLKTSFTYQQLAFIFSYVCGCPLDICSLANCHALSRFYNKMQLIYATEPPASPSACRETFAWYFYMDFGTGDPAAWPWERIRQAYIHCFESGCGPDISQLCAGEDPLDCKTLEEIKQEFIEMGGPDVDPEECQANWVNYFRERTGRELTYAEITALYLEICGEAYSPCSQCPELQAIKEEFLAGYHEGEMSQEECEEQWVSFFNEAMGMELSYNEITEYYFLHCGERFSPCRPAFTCGDSYEVIVRFRTETEYNPETCQDDFVQFFNSYYGLQLNYEQIMELYASECNIELDICSMELPVLDCEQLQQFLNSYRESHPDPGGEFGEECESYFVNSFNDAFGVSFPIGIIKAYYKLYCDMDLDPCASSGEQLAGPDTPEPETAGTTMSAATERPRLCGLNEVVFNPPPVDINTCKISDTAVISMAEEKYQLYLDSLRDVFDAAYLEKCLSAKSMESFTVRFANAEHHFTLYYYDQAGNLVKTVPPEGVEDRRGDDTFLDDVKQKRLNAKLFGPSASNRVTPNHTLASEYRYNTLNQVVAQRTPDAGKSEFYYDQLGRLVVSQNARQAVAATKQYSYTLYDKLGRITEVGQVARSGAMDGSFSRDKAYLENWLNGGVAEQVTRTVYDRSYFDGEGSLCSDVVCQRNLRNRVSYSAVYDGLTRPGIMTPAITGTHQTASYYTYDIHGNVDTLVQDLNSGSMLVGNRFKRIAYTYDLVSGKVNSVSYQPGAPDQFYHKYSYDGENRLLKVFTSPDNVNWEEDAAYEYYSHGPLSRVVIGHQQVQGVDYGYTLQGWLKGVNSTSLDTKWDMGEDGKATGTHPKVARDVYAFSLDYYGTSHDYKPINNTVKPFATAAAAGFGFKALYNGNIAGMSVSIPQVGQPLLYTYYYDQLNRIVQMNTYKGLNPVTNAWNVSAIDDYREKISYDANGNILTYERNGTTQGGRPLAMDKLTYQYPKVSGKLQNNRLRYVDDQVTSTNYPDEDIDSQTGTSVPGAAQGTDYYQYDEIGNLTKDGNTTITWNVYGKIESVQKPGMSIYYTYDAAGNRISKKLIQSEFSSKTTWYVRDASGNVMSVYQTQEARNSEPTIIQQEVHLYGSSRLGLWQANRILHEPQIIILPPWEGGGLQTEADVRTENVVFFRRGAKQYELTNHLGNVLVTISDKKRGVDDNSDGLIDYYTAVVISANDYYPFGMLMPGRKYQGGGYRYGFNGQEKSDEVQNNNFTAEFWEYNTQTARRWNLDPKPLPWESLYAVNKNNPIWVQDPRGDQGETEKDKRKSSRAQKRFDKKIAKPLRELDVELRRQGQTESQVQATVQAEADRLAAKYQNKKWIHWVLGRPSANDLSNTNNYKSDMTGMNWNHVITIKAYQTTTTDYNVDSRRTAGGMVTTGTVGTVAAGSTVTVQFNPLGIANSLVVSTQATDGSVSPIANTGGMIADPRSRFGVFIFQPAPVLITVSSAGVLSYTIQNTFATALRDTWELRISVTSAPVLNPVPVYYSGNIKP